MITDEQARIVIGHNVARLRGDRSLSWLARAVGTHPIHISRIESGNNMPGAGLLIRLAEALETSVETLISANPKKTRKRA